MVHQIRVTEELRQMALTTPFSLMALIDAKTYGHLTDYGLLDIYPKAIAYGMSLRQVIALSHDCQVCQQLLHEFYTEAIKEAIRKKFKDRFGSSID